MTKFYPGQKVICINDESQYFGLKKGLSYTVRKIADDGRYIHIEELAPTLQVRADRFGVPGQAPEGVASSAITEDFGPDAPKTTAVGTGIKYDQDKPDMSLLSAFALVEVAKVMTFGKKKYSANNWRGGFAWTRPLSACLRHVFAFLSGEDKDPETGLSHLAHAICCLMFVLEFTITKAGVDDRYKSEVKDAKAS